MPRAYLDLFLVDSTILNGDMSGGQARSDKLVTYAIWLA